MSTATTERPRGRTAAPAGPKPPSSVAAPEAPIDIVAFAAELQGAAAILEYLVHIFTGASDLDSPEQAEGIMGTMQHLQRLLGDLYLEMLEVDAPLPDALRWGVFEAWSLVSLLESLFFASDFGETFRLNHGITSAYLETVLRAVERAEAALVEVEWRAEA